MQLGEYEPKANAGVDALVRAATKTSAGGRLLVAAHAFFVNTPPKVVAAAFDLFAKDLAALSYDRVLVAVKTSAPGGAPAPAKKKKAKKAKECDRFEDDAFAKRAASAVDVGPQATLLVLAPDAYAAAVAEIAALAAQ